MANEKERELKLTNNDQAFLASLVGRWGKYSHH